MKEYKLEGTSTFFGTYSVCDPNFNSLYLKVRKVHSSVNLRHIRMGLGGKCCFSIQQVHGLVYTKPML